MSARPFAVVTGATTGIGRAFAEQLARAGHDLLITARTRDALEARAEAITRETGVEVRVVPVDLAEPDAADAVWRAIGDRPVDILVNNAGYNVCGPFAKADPAGQIGMIRVHIEATLLLTRRVLPGMIAAGKGRIVNLASIASHTPTPGDAVYCAAKAFILSFSDALAAETEGTGVTVTALCPGATATEFARRAGLDKTPLFTFGVMDANTVVRAGLRASERGRVAVVPGFHNKLTVASAHILPRCVRNFFGRALIRGAEANRA